MIPFEEIDDQFLRLREVLKCNISIVPNNNSNDYEAHINITENALTRLNDINEEVERIKRFLKSKFPSVVVEIKNKYRNNRRAKKAVIVKCQ